jgi:hypothetical protein
MSFMPFLARGFSVTGLRLLDAMLAEAARRALRRAVVHADIRALPDLGRFDLVTCFDDALNYLLSRTSSRRRSRGWSAASRPAGWPSST